MKRKLPLMKITLGSILGLCIAIAVYMVVGIGDVQTAMNAYNNVNPDSNSGFSRALQFLESYTRATGDITLAMSIGLSEEDAKGIVRGGSQQNEGAGGYTGVPTEGDWTPYAIEVIQHLGTSYDCNNYRNCSFVNGTYGYGTPCCCCLVELVLTNAGKVPSANTSMGHCDGLATRYGSSVAFTESTTFGELQVGDVFCYYGNRDEGASRICHVDMIIKIEGTTVYIANGGSSNSLDRCGSQGYSYTVQTTDLVKSTLESHYYDSDHIDPYDLQYIKRG